MSLKGGLHTSAVTLSLCDLTHLENMYATLVRTFINPHQGTIQRISLAFFVQFREAHHLFDLHISFCDAGSQKMASYGPKISLECTIKHLTPADLLSWLLAKLNVDLTWLGAEWKMDIYDDDSLIILSPIPSAH